MYVILVYDIRMDDKGKKILPKIFKLCKKYLNHVQNSVFEGELTKAQITELKINIQEITRKDTDSVILFKSRNSRWLDREVWAKEDTTISNFL